MSLFTSWGHQYGTRKINKYRQEFTRYPYDHKDRNAFIDSLFTAGTYSLDPPKDLCHSELCDMLKQGSIEPPFTGGPVPPMPGDQIYIDDRRSTLDEAVAGELDSKSSWEGHIGKHEMCTVGDFFAYVTTTERHRIESNSERRGIFIASPSADGLLALTASTSRRSRPFILDFLQKHLVSQADMFMVCSKVQFGIGFHLPYFAVRKGPRLHDTRNVFGRPLRKVMPLPLSPVDDDESPDYYYYEAKISYLIIGLDDFFFTTYCLVDTYHGGTETDRADYVDAYNGVGLEPASRRSFEFPFWNPREHMFASFSARLVQITKEVAYMVGKFDEFMRSFEDNPAWFDMDLIQTQNLLPTVDTLHELRSSVQGIVAAWTRFADTHLEWFKATEYEALSKSLKTYQKTIEVNIAELRMYNQLLDKRCLQFEGRLHRIMNASLLQHNANVAKMQHFLGKVGRNAHMFAGIAFFFLGLNLVVAIFGMNMVSQNTHWAWPTVSLIMVAGLSYWLTVDSRVLNRMFPLYDADA